MILLILIFSFFTQRYQTPYLCTPASRISILQQKTKLAFNKSYFTFHKVITNSNKVEKLRQVVFSWKIKILEIFKRYFYHFSFKIKKKQNLKNSTSSHNDLLITISISVFTKYISITISITSSSASCSIFFIFCPSWRTKKLATYCS